MRKLELLAPAKNLECGIAAVEHGADAVYIGAPRFGARAAAGNSVEDIAQLCRFAHQFGAKVYVTTNTIIYDDELKDTFQLIDELKQAGVDALLVQDMALLQVAKDKQIQLHASTQTDNRTPEKVSWLRSLGFRRVVLARELSLEEIREIHRREPDVELEVFVHGALCVSYSGQCYMSQYCLGRSANRGECAQMCRMKYDLIDADGNEIEHQRHLLSLRDLCRIDSLEELADAGAVSFKIEGRLKEVAYVKNVVSAYSKRLDALCAKRPKDYERASKGRVTYSFEPNLQKTFNRGFTDYFLHCYRDEKGVLQGRQPDIVSLDTPKALGEYVGKVKELRRDSFTVSGMAAFANGDGLCFFNERKELVGFRVNRAEGNRLFPLKMPEGLRPGLGLYRNKDVAFERLMAGNTAERKMKVTMVFRSVDEGFQLEMREQGKGEDNATLATCLLPMAPDEKALAQKPQTANIVAQCSKLGNTPFVCDEVRIEGEADRYFVRSSQLAELRRQCVEEALVQLGALDRLEKLGSLGTLGTLASLGSLGPLGTLGKLASLEPLGHLEPLGTLGKEAPLSPRASASVPTNSETRRYPYLLNASNRLARAFYEQQGVTAGKAFELTSGQPSAGQSGAGALLMQCRYCIKFSLGYCVNHGGRKPIWREPLSLRLGDGHEFRLEFDCKQCQMKILSKR
ncbi:MAG: U32 family peptidase [Prevotella sp.]|nr:U32 family peptidase [Prevotella sp.]